MFNCYRTHELVGTMAGVDLSICRMMMYMYIKFNLNAVETPYALDLGERNPH